VIDQAAIALDSRSDVRWFEPFLVDPFACDQEQGLPATLWLIVNSLEEFRWLWSQIVVGYCTRLLPVSNVGISMKKPSNDFIFCRTYLTVFSLMKVTAHIKSQFHYCCWHNTSVPLHFSFHLSSYLSSGITLPYISHHHHFQIMCGPSVLPVRAGVKFGGFMPGIPTNNHGANNEAPSSIPGPTSLPTPGDMKSKKYSKS